MNKLTWNKVGGNFYETGVSRGVLYLQDEAGNYPKGVPWNGLVGVTESPSGSEVTPLYSDGVVHTNSISIEEFEATIDALTYPDEFAACDGSLEQSQGFFLNQQTRNPFGLSYVTFIGNDIRGEDHGYKLHLVYGAVASPSQRAYPSVNDSVSTTTFSWAITTTPVDVSNNKPTAALVIDSTKVDPYYLARLEQILYGVNNSLVEPRLPLPDEVIAILSGELTPSGIKLIRFKVGYTAIGEGAIS